MTASGNRGWCSDLSDRVRVIRDNDVWRVTERSCFDEFSRERLGGNVGEKGEVCDSVFWLCIGRISRRRAQSEPVFLHEDYRFHKLFMKLYCTLCERLFFFEKSNTFIEAYSSSEFILLFYSREIWQIFLFTLFVSFNKIDFFLDKFIIIPRMINEIRWALL